MHIYQRIRDMREDADLTQIADMSVVKVRSHLILR